MRTVLLFFLIIFIVSCGDSSSAGGAKTDTGTSEPVNPADRIPDTRDTVSKAPVAEYKVRTDNPLNEWYFGATLYETKKTFHYLLKLQYEEIKGTDTLRLPNFGTMPKPEIVKGDNKFACIIGFRDNENKFREYKKVFVDNNRLRVVALKHYAVYTTQRKDSSDK